MIRLIFHIAPTVGAMKTASTEMRILFDFEEEPKKDFENDNFYFTLEADRETALEMKQSLSERGFPVTVKSDVEALYFD